MVAMVIVGYNGDIKTQSQTMVSMVTEGSHRDTQTQDNGCYDSRYVTMHISRPKVRQWLLWLQWVTMETCEKLDNMETSKLHWRYEAQGKYWLLW